MTPEERGSVINGIWLCQTHAKAIDDDVTQFSVEVLRAWKRHAEEEARALLGRPISDRAFDVSAEVVLHRVADGALIATGTTNLPDGTKLWVRLAKQRDQEGSESKTTVLQGMFTSGNLTNGRGQYAHGWYVVELLAYFNGPWQQPDAVLALTGHEGDYLAGRFAEPLHPELPASEKRFHAFFDCIAPLAATGSGRTAADVDGAVNTVQGATLVVDGRLSSMTIADGVSYYMGAPGLAVRNGWSGTALPNGLILVRFSFWSGSREAVAEWSIVPEDGEIRYHSLDAKCMSWIPDY